MRIKKSLAATIATGGGLLLALTAPLSASAHVTINPNSADAGSYTVVTVRVPNESATASTIKVELTLPQDTPFSSVRYVPVAGWGTELVRETLAEPVMVGDREITEAVTKVIWTADATSGIVEGQLQQFDLSLGPVPDTGSIIFKADQYYSDGEIVSWNEVGHDVEHPAPILYVNDEAPGGHHGGGNEPEAVNEDLAVTATSNDGLARGLGIGGIVVGAVGVMFGITARRKVVN